MDAMGHGAELRAMDLVRHHDDPTTDGHLLAGDSAIAGVEHGDDKVVDR
nr:unnamed protein product [Digitaria exilis]